jgi:hypothetical protein
MREGEGFDGRREERRDVGLRRYREESTRRCMEEWMRQPAMGGERADWEAGND